ncbi:uncharacterized protein LOC105849132 [Hydra vulgaris]|uniref:uncharacterized protein LOC105849132 n=1 Tax=Hydra vulgaris TaxID=6087 RepID=UPI001F5FA250|nr:uncharacterized protein LOC105849132 [Hydra vulgaris]
MTLALKKKSLSSFFHFQKNNDEKQSFGKFQNEAADAKSNKSLLLVSPKKVRSQPTSPSVLMRSTKEIEATTPDKLLNISHMFKIALRSRSKNNLMDGKGSPFEDLSNEKKSKWEKISKKLGSRESIDSIENQSNHSLRNERSLSVGSTGPTKRRLGVDQNCRSNSLCIDLFKSSSFKETKSSNTIISTFTGKRHSNTFNSWSKFNQPEHISSGPLLHIAASNGNMELLKTLSDVGVDLNEHNSAGWPALHYAICSGNFEAAHFLINKGASIIPYSNRVINTLNLDKL